MLIIRNNQRKIQQQCHNKYIKQINSSLYNNHNNLKLINQIVVINIKPRIHKTQKMHKFSNNSPN